MAASNGQVGQHLFTDDNGVPYPVGTKVFIYEADSVNTKKDSYASYENWQSSNPQSNPILLTAGGKCDIWVDGTYKMVLAPANDTDPPTSAIYTKDNLGAETSSVTTGISNKIENGSFEIDTDADGTPDSWTFTPGSGNTIALDDTDSNHGAKSLKMTIASANTAVAETDFFEVAPGEPDIFSGSLKCSAATASIVIRMVWYDLDQGFISNTDLYTNSATNPTSWTHTHIRFTPPANATYAKLQLRVATTAHTVWWDYIHTQECDAIESTDLTINADWTFSGSTTFSGTSTFSGNVVSDLTLSKVTPRVYIRASDSNDSFLYFQNSTTGSSASDGSYIGIDSTEQLNIMNRENTLIRIGTNALFRAYVAADGGIYTTNAIGGSKGADTINAKGMYRDNNSLWGPDNDGSGSGLDADTVDSIEGASLLRSDAADVFTGPLTASGLTPQAAGTVNAAGIYVNDVAVGINGHLEETTYSVNAATMSIQVLPAGTDYLHVPTVYISAKAYIKVIANENTINLSLRLYNDNDTDWTWKTFNDDGTTVASDTSGSGSADPLLCTIPAIDDEAHITLELVSLDTGVMTVTAHTKIVTDTATPTMGESYITQAYYNGAGQLTGAIDIKTSGTTGIKSGSKAKCLSFVELA